MTEKKKTHNELQLIKKPRFEIHVSLNDVFCELITRLYKATPVVGPDDDPTMKRRHISVTEDEWQAIKRLLSIGNDPLSHLFSLFNIDKKDETS